jgi:hypothetical protein
MMTPTRPSWLRSNETSAYSFTFVGRKVQMG